MLLAKLDDPIPEKIVKPAKIVKLKTISEMCSTEPILGKKNKSILIRLDSENKVDCHTKPIFDLVSVHRPCTAEKKFRKTSQNNSNSLKPCEQQRVRCLITEKLAEKHKIKSRRKPRGLIDPQIITRICWKLLINITISILSMIFSVILIWLNKIYSEKGEKMFNK